MDTAVPGTTCQHFKANLWRPHTCTNCYKAKSVHQQNSESSTRSLLKRLTGTNRLSKKELRQVASIATLGRETVCEGQCQWEELENMPQKQHRNGPMIGVVKPYAVVDIDEDSNETSLDGITLKSRFNESANHKAFTNVRNESNTLAVVKIKNDNINSSNQSLNNTGVTDGEASYRETVPRPSKVIGKLLEYHRSLSVMSVDGQSENLDVASFNDDANRYKRGKSVEPLDTQRTKKITVKRSSSLRQEAPKSSKILGLLTRRKVSSPSAHVKPIESSLQHVTSKFPLKVEETQPKVTSPHPVRRNKATVHLYSHTLLSKRQGKKELVAVPARPRNLTLPTSVILNEEADQEKEEKKRTPPAKPPRTLSTFFTSTEQEHLFQQLLECPTREAQDKQVQSHMKNELQTDGDSVGAPQRPQRSARSSGYDRVVRFPRGEVGSQQHVAPRLPPGHPGDYAKVFSSSWSGNPVSSKYDSIELSLPTPSSREPCFKIGIVPPPPLSQRHRSASPHPLTQSQRHTSSSPYPHNSTTSDTQTPTPSNDKEEYYSVPCASPKDEDPVEPYYSRPYESPAEEESNYYSLPCASPKEESQASESNYYSLPFTLHNEDIDATDLDNYSLVTAPAEDEPTLTEQASKREVIQATPPAPPTSRGLSTLLNSTLVCLVDRESEQLLCSEDLSKCVGWDELKITSEQEAVYNGYTFSVKATETIDAEIKQSIEISKLLTPHINLSLVRSMLTTPTNTPPSQLIQAPHYLLTDYIGTNAADFLLSHRHSLTPDAYTHHVLHTLTQLFSALTYLQANGVCHRDVGMESIYGQTIGDSWLVKLGDFNYALHRPGPVCSNTFVYGYHELKWLGGVDSRLPPEVINTPENAQTVNYCHTDCFSAGCMLYELCSHSNPFETSAELIFQQYTDEDLPHLELDSKLTPSLEKLALLLVQRDTDKRLTASSALLICQVLKWLPEEWLTVMPSEQLVRGWLSLRRGQLVCEAAKREEKTLPLDVVLEGRFVSQCNVSDLIGALSLFGGH